MCIFPIVSKQRVDKYISPSVARQRLGKDVPAATKDLCRRHFYAVLVDIKGNWTISFLQNSWFYF
jgi:hypothetical protein